jgi:hypothetical protein
MFVGVCPDMHGDCLENAAVICFGLDDPPDLEEEQRE